MTNPIGYTNRQNVENFLGRTFPEVGNGEFDRYIAQAEAYINNFCGYNAQTTVSGIMTQNVIREKVTGKIDSFDNLVVDLMKPPVHFDANNNPMVTLMEFNFGAIRVGLQLTDGTNNGNNSILIVSENRRKIVYPSLYFFPAISTVTPTAKVNLFNLRDVKFWIDVSYTGGYDEVPADIEAAANYLVSEFITKRDNPASALSIGQGSYRVDYISSRPAAKGESTSHMVSKANELLQPYVRYTW